MRYHIEQRIETLANNAVMKDGGMVASFSVGKIAFSHWEFASSRNWLFDWWLVDTSIEADNYKAAFQTFRQNLSRIIPRISLISQTYIDYLRQPFLIVKDGGHVGFLRYTVSRKGTGLMFMENHVEALNRLLGDPSISEEFYYYWNDAVNAVGYTPKLLLMFSAIESLTRIRRGEKDWVRIEQMLGKELKEDLFGIEGDSRSGLRHRLIHGEYFGTEDSGKNYVELIHKKVMAYFNDYVLKERLLDLEVVNPQRHFWGNADEGRWFIKPKGQGELSLKSILADFAKNGFDNLEHYEYVYDSALEANY